MSSKERRAYRNVLSTLITDRQLRAYNKLLRRTGMTKSADLRLYVVKRIEEANLYRLDDDPETALDDEPDGDEEPED